MVEALGREYWPTFMDCIARNLKPGGCAAIQYISMRDELFDDQPVGQRGRAGLGTADTDEGGHAGQRDQAASHRTSPTWPR